MVGGDLLARPHAHVWQTWACDVSNAGAAGIGTAGDPRGERPCQISSATPDRQLG